MGQKENTEKINYSESITDLLRKADEIKQFITETGNVELADALRNIQEKFRKRKIPPEFWLNIESASLGLLKNLSEDLKHESDKEKRENLTELLSYEIHKREKLILLKNQ